MCCPAGGSAEGLLHPRWTSALRAARDRQSAAAPRRRRPEPERQSGQQELSERRRRNLAAESQNPRLWGHQGARRLAQVRPAGKWSPTWARRSGYGSTDLNKCSFTVVSPVCSVFQVRCSVRPRLCLREQHSCLCRHWGPQSAGHTGRVRVPRPGASSESVFGVSVAADLWSVCSASGEGWVQIQSAGSVHGQQARWLPHPAACPPTSLCSPSFKQHQIINSRHHYVCVLQCRDRRWLLRRRFRTSCRRSGRYERHTAAGWKDETICSIRHTGERKTG